MFKKKSLLVILIAIVIVVSAVLWWRYDLQFRYYAQKTDQDIAKVKDYYSKAQEWEDKKSNPQTEEEESNKFDYVIEAARAYEYAGNYNKAIALYLGYTPDESTNEFYVYYSNLAKLYEKKGDYQTAVIKYQFIVEKYPTNFYPVYLDLANAYLELGDKEKAKENYLKYKNLTGYLDEAFELRQK